MTLIECVKQMTQSYKQLEIAKSDCKIQVDTAYQAYADKADDNPKAAKHLQKVAAAKAKLTLEDLELDSAGLLELIEELR